MSYLKLLEKERKKLGSLDKSRYTQQHIDDAAKKYQSPSVRTDSDDDDDIAPLGSASNPYKINASGESHQKEVKSALEEEKREKDGLDFFDSGAFKDGFDWHDPLTAIGGTVLDAAFGVGKGAWQTVEGISDLLLYGAAGVSSLVGAKETANYLKKEAQSNTVEKYAKPVDKWLEQYSLLGDTTNAVAEGVGNSALLFSAGAAAKAAGWASSGITALTTGTTFASSTGSGISEAYNSGEDVSDLDAVTYGVMKGAVEAGTEALWGGIGKGVNATGISHGVGGADDMLANKLTEKLTNQTVKNLAKFGIKSAGEGAEEVIAGVGTAVAKKLTYMSEEDLSKLIEDEKLLESFVVGTLSSSITQSGVVPGMSQGGLKESIQTGRDFVTGYTQNEQKVFDKEVENRISEKEANGEKVTNKDKKDIKEAVAKDMERGYISVETIEDVLGDRTAYDSLKQESDEFNTLYESEVLSEKQKDRLAELKEKNKTTPYETALKDAQNKNSQNVLELLQKDGRGTGSILLETYRERARLAEDFKADLSKYEKSKHKDAAQKTIESAIAAGANNSNRVHDLVDMAAKTSADTGLTFTFKSGEQIKKDFIERQTNEISKLEAIENPTAEQTKKLDSLKDTLAKVESGKMIVDGDITSDGIVLNLDSAKPLNRVVGHEITHSFEPGKGKTSKEYTGLRDALFSYAQTKGVNIDQELEARRLKYEGITNADPEAELVADLVGDYLFTDTEFVNNLSVQNRNVFQKLWDEVKYLYNIATAGSKEKRELARVRKAFEDAYRKSAEAKMSDVAGDSEVKYSIREEAPPTNTKKAYKLMRLVDGKLYPLFIGNNEEVSVGTWYNADSPNLSHLKDLSPGTHLVNMETGEAITWDEYAADHVPAKNGKPARVKPNKDDIHWANENGYRFMYIEDKAGGKSESRMLKQYGDTRAYYNWGVNGSSKSKSGEGSASLYALRPGWHFGEVPSMHQIGYGGEDGDTVRLDNQVWVEVEMSADVDYNEEAASNWGGDIPTHIPTDGYYKFATNPTQKKTKKGDTSNDAKKADWYVSGAFKVNRILSDHEADAVVEKYNAENGTNVPLDYRRNGGRVFNAETMQVEDSVKYSLTEVTPAEIKTIQGIGQKSINHFNSHDIAATEKFAEQYWKEMGTKSPFYRAWFGDWRENDQTPVVVATKQGDTRVDHINKDTGWTIRNSRMVHNETTSHNSLKDREAVPYLPYIDEIIENAVLLDTKGVGRPKSENSLLMHYLYAVADIGNGAEVLKLTVEEMYNPGIKGTKKRAYTLQNIEKAFAASVMVQGKSPSHITNTANAVNTVSDLFALVKQMDGKFVPNSSSKIVNADGTPKMMYHGSPEQFTKFDRSKAKSSGHYGKGFYFTDSESHAGTYGNLYKVYLNIQNPLQYGAGTVSRDQVRSYLEAIAENEDYSIENYGTYDIDEILNIVMGKENSVDAFKAINDINATAIGDMVEAAELFNRVNETTYDGIVAPTETVAFYPEQIKSATDNIGTFDKSNPDIRFSMSDGSEQFVPSRNDIYGKDFRVQKPMQETVSEMETVAPVGENVDATENATITEDLFPDDSVPLQEEYESLIAEREDIRGAMDAYAAIGDTANAERLMAEYDAVQARIAEIEHDDADRFASLDDADAPPEIDNSNPEDVADNVPLTKALVTDLAKQVKAKLGIPNKRTAEVRDLIERYSKEEFPSKAHLYTEIAERFGSFTETQVDEELKGVKSLLRTYGINVDDSIKQDIADYGQFMRSNFGRIRFSKDGLPVDVAYQEFQEALPGYFPASVDVPTDQLMRIVEVANMDDTIQRTEYIDSQTLEEATDAIMNTVGKFKQNRKETLANKHGREAFKGMMESADQYAPPIQERFAPVKQTVRPAVQSDPQDIAPVYDTSSGQQAFMPDAEVPKKITRGELHESIVDNIKTTFREKGFDFDEVLKKAKDLSTFATVDNTPQRVMEKALGYKQGQLLGDLTVNKVAQNETEGIKWLNSFTDRKNGLLAKISKQYGIKPGSKASAAAQMYAEGFYVGKNNEIIAYGDAELAKDFPKVKVQENIKGLAKDPRIRQIYDETLAMINESRTRNAYPEIPRLDNYFLHFRAMDDTFSRLGLPFNPNDIRAKDLPTDLNGVTADLKPGQPYFASAMHRTGKRTSFDLLGGLEKYLTSAKNQIYHIDDIQTLRALRNFVADTYGQANGLEGLDALTEEEAQERIEKVYDSHLSTFAKFLNEEANVLAGKTPLIDRGLEGIIGRRGITLLDSINRQVGANMVGYNISSSMTNFLSTVQGFAKTNKFDFVKGFAQFSANKVKSIFGEGDGFADSSPVMIRRKGAERFHRTAWEKMSDPGYALMGAVDSISTELVARAKYNELTRKGMDSQQAHIETDKWVSRLFGDRSLGQQPQLYNSKMLGLFTKFQLEVRNQLDSQFYDTIQEAKVSNEYIQNGLLRNAKTAAKVTSTFFQLAVGQHLFGKAFESMAGYNPSFDIISVLLTAFGFDDDEESEDTTLDNIEQAFLELLEDLPYTSTFTGGRIPISSALPIAELIKGEDQYGNEKSRWDTLKEIAPYYLLPGGYGQIKKTVQGLGMFSDEHLIAGSYTDSGSLRFPVEDTWQNRLQAGLFGQYASGNARDYFDNERSPLNEKQIQEFIDVGISIQDYWKYRDGLKGLDTLAEKADYIYGLDLTKEQKNVLINNIADRKEDIDMSDYGNYGSFEEFDFAEKNPEKYSFLKENNVSYSQYKNFDEDTKDAWSWAFNYPEKFTMSKVIAGDLLSYKKYSKALSDIRADIDENGKTISGSAKAKKINYINGLDIDYGQKIILFRSLYKADDTYNYEIVDYLNNRDDISYDDMVVILRELGFTVLSDGTVQW